MKGDGRIFPRKRSPYLWCSYYVRGVEHRESTGTADPKKAERFLQAKRDAIGADWLGAQKFVAPAKRRLTVNDLLDGLQLHYEGDHKWSKKVASNMQPMHDYFGHIRAADLTTQDVDRWIRHALKHGRREDSRKPAKPATVNRSTQLLSQAYRLAIRRGDLVSAPFITKLSEEGNARHGFFTEQEFRAVLDNLPDYLQDFILFCYLTGWRKGEARSLRWEDMEGDALIRLRDIHSKNGDPRSVSVVGELAEVISRRQRARWIKTASGAVVMADLIFHKDGKPVGDFRKAWKTACTRAGVAGRVPHDLRRTCVRNLIRAGVPTDTARQITGHKTAAVFSRYNIVAEDQKRDALVRMQEYLSHEQPKTVAIQ